MRSTILARFFSWLHGVGLGAKRRGGELVAASPAAADERALFLDPKVLARAKQQLGDDGRHWGRVLASLTLACGLLLSVPASAAEETAAAAASQEEISLLALVIELLDGLMDNGEGGSGDPGSGQ